MKKSFFILSLLFASYALQAQLPFPLPGSDTKKAAQPEKDRLDSLLSLLTKKKYKTRPYESIITRDAVAYTGLFTVYAVRDSFFIEIPDTLLGRDMQMVTRVVKGSVSKGASGAYIYPGESLEEKAVYFRTAPDSAINLLEDIQAAQADPGSRIAGSVANANLDPIVQTFQIVGVGQHKSSLLVDATAFIKTPGKLTNIMERPSTTIHVEYVHAYPINVEVGIYRISGGVPVVTNTSFIALPKTPMPQRLFDRRVGYFADNASYFSDDQHKVEKREFILRWRMEPRPEDRERWIKGELVEPAKPIVIYIDPHTPKQWVKYLILGINDWQKAFEQAGFKNAIMGKEWPEGDSANLDDARYSFVCYLPSEIANAYGPPSVHDPRSGEIIQTHIGWYHNVMTILHDWYLTQAGATDPRARQAKFDDELMGQLIRFVSSHEVGHTLGLRHNFGSSSKTPVEKMRDREWLAAHGHTASIMDYARFNYVAQPEDNIPEELLWPRIGEYDRWAIEWGYKYSGAQSVEEDKKITRKWATERLAANPRLWFGSQEGEKGQGMRPDDPRCQTEDLGDNNMLANAYGIKNLKRILPNLPAWSREETGLYDNLGTAYQALTAQFKRYMGHVLTNIGGVERTWQSEDAGGDVYVPVAKAKQKQALAFFNEQLFTTPLWLLDPSVTRKVVNPLEANFVGDVQIRILNTLLDTSIFNKLSANVARFGAAAAYPLEEYLSDVHRCIWGGLASGKPMDLYRRNLQKTYIGALSDILASLKPEITETEAYGLARADLQRLLNEMTMHVQKYSGLDRTHLESQIAVVRKVLNPRQD